MNFENFLEKINGMIWGNGLIFLLIGCGLFYTIRLGFIQLRLIPELLKTSAKTKSEGDGISQIKTIFLSLGTAMGTGNITGVCEKEKRKGMIRRSAKMSQTQYLHLAA